MEEMSLTYPPLNTWMTITTYSHMFVMGLLQWNKVYTHGQDELHRPPVVALTFRQYGCHMSCVMWESPWRPESSYQIKRRMDTHMMRPSFFGMTPTFFFILFSISWCHFKIRMGAYTYTNRRIVASGTFLCDTVQIYWHQHGEDQQFNLICINFLIAVTQSAQGISFQVIWIIQSELSCKEKEILLPWIHISRTNRIAEI